MRPTIHTPHAALHRRIKFDPIRRIHPIFGHALRGTHPGFPTVFAAEKPYVRGGDELPVGIKRIKMVAVSIRHIESGGCPTTFP